MSENTMREKFYAQRKDDYFKFVGKVGDGRSNDFVVVCKNCNETFKTCRDVLKGDYHLTCKFCGLRDDGSFIFARTKDVEKIVDFYSAGHSVSETAETFNTTKGRINNLVKKHKLTNGKDWGEQAQKSNQNRHEEATKRHDPVVGCKKHSHRAKIYGCEFEMGISLKKLIDRDGLVCYLCGEQCDTNDKSYGSIGPLYPTIDHVIPLSKGGGHTWSNVKIAHFMCNVRKGDSVEDVSGVSV